MKIVCLVFLTVCAFSYGQDTTAFQVPPDFINTLYEVILQLGPEKTLVLEKLFKSDIENGTPIGQVAGATPQISNILSNLALKGFSESFQAAGPGVWNEAKQFLALTKAEQIDVMNTFISLTQSALDISPDESDLNLSALPSLETLDAAPNANIILPPPPTGSLEQIYTNP